MKPVHMLSMALVALGPVAPATCQQATTTSTVAQVRLDAHGRTTGWILSDGTEVEVPVAEFQRLAPQAHVGDRLAISTNGTDTLHVVDVTSGHTLDLGTGPLAARGGGPRDDHGNAAPVDDARGLTPLRRSGRVAMVLHTPRGHRSGFVLADGTQVHMIPDVDFVLNQVHAGDQLAVRGRGTDGPTGGALWATYIGRGAAVLLDTSLDPGGVPELGM